MDAAAIADMRYLYRSK